MARRRGFALLTVLWVMVGASLLSVQVAHTSRESIGTAENRIGNRRAAWIAEGCLAALRAVVDERLALAGDVEGVWSALDDEESAVAGTAECETTLSPAGTTLDVNTAGRDELATLFGAAGMTRGAADSLADAICDWRDPDSEVRPDGAEAAWYVGQQRPVPRDSAFASGAELRLVRGWTASLDSLHLLGVESDALLLSRASPMVLSTVPGTQAGVVPALEAAQRVTLVPDAWIATAVATDRVSRIRTGIEVRLVRSGRRAAVVRHRTLPWQ